MQKRVSFGSFLTFLALSLSWCGCSPAPATPESPSAPAASGDAKEAVNAAVLQFLNAVRSGQDETVFKMMSPTARQICSRDKIPSLPASDSAQFTIDEITLLGSDGAHVRTTMIDLDEQGEKVEESLVWALRSTSEGWRIAGVAFSLFEGYEPIVVNFESKEDIAKAEAQALAQQQAVLAEVQKLEAAQQQQRQQEPQPQQQAQPQVGASRVPAGAQ